MTTDIAAMTPEPDAWKQLSDLQDRFTRTWEIRHDLEVVALAHKRNVRLVMGDYTPAALDPAGIERGFITDRNVSTMREFALAILDACHFVEESNPRWASHPAGSAYFKTTVDAGPDGGPFIFVVDADATVFVDDLEIDLTEWWDWPS